jgi:hypothetical protein
MSADVLSSAIGHREPRHAAERPAAGLANPVTRSTREAIMSQFIATTKHVRYVLGSLTAVLFAICIGNS